MIRTTSVLGLLLFVNVAAKDTSFGPPRLAVVDTPTVFANYAKKQALEQTSRSEKTKLEAKLESLECRRSKLAEELKHMEETQAEEKLVEKFRLELKIKWLKENDLPAILKKNLEYVDVIRAEIENSIDKFAKAEALDMVLEKTFVLETGGPVPLRWPVVHFAKPELDITGEIILRLNDLYSGK